MSKSSRRNQKAAQDQVQQDQAQSQTVRPVRTGSQKGGVKKTPQTRKQSPYVSQQPQDKTPEPTRDKKIDDCLEKLTNLCSRHDKVLEDHEWRIHGLEKWQERQNEFVNKMTPIAAALEKDGLKMPDEQVNELTQQFYEACAWYSRPMADDEVTEVTGSDAAKTQPIDLSSDEDDLMAKLQPTKSKAADPQPVEPHSANPQPADTESGEPFRGLVPVQMYLAWNHLEEYWMGPFSRISAATQAVADLAGAGQSNYRAAMLGSTQIVWYWVDPKTGDVGRRLTGEELLRYAPR